MLDFEDTNQEPYATIKVVNISEIEDTELKETLAKECECAEFITINPNIFLKCEEFEENLRGSDLTFVVAEDNVKCINFATTVSEYVYSVGSITIGVVKKSKDFKFDEWENCKDENVKQFKEKLDTIFAISKVNILPLIKSIYDLIAKPELINLDFPNLKYILQDGSFAFIGIAKSLGETSSVNAVKKALYSPTLKTTLKDARRILLNFTGSESSINMINVNNGFAFLQGKANPRADIIFGASIDNSMNDNISVTIIATGFNDIDD